MDNNEHTFIWARGRPPFIVNYKNFVTQGAPNPQHCIRVTQLGNRVILWTHGNGNDFMFIHFRKEDNGDLTHINNVVRHNNENLYFEEISVDRQDESYRVDGYPFLEFWCKFSLDFVNGQLLTKEETTLLLQLCQTL